MPSIDSNESGVIQLRPIHAAKEVRMAYLLLTQMLLVSTLAVSAHPKASCEVANGIALRRSPAGSVQVGNLDLLQITCRVATRPWPLRPGETRKGLDAQVAVYQILADGSRRMVDSEVNVSGGGLEDSIEWVNFYLNIPLGKDDREAEMQRLIDNLEKAISELPADRRHLYEKLRISQSELQGFAPIVITQHRTGRFEVECRVLDDTRVLGVGSIEMKILFKGRFSDAVLRKIKAKAGARD